MNSDNEWPSLVFSDWVDTKETLHLWTQIVGKVRLALAPRVNHWWEVPLYVTARGLGTSAMPYGAHSVEMTFDFLDHALRIETSQGGTAHVRLEPMTVADFYHATMGALKDLGVGVRIWPHPVEMIEAIPFEEDEKHGSYDADAARRFWTVLEQATRVMQQFRGGFIGKCSPVHFWWGGFDLACTRFSGRPAPLHPGGIPNCPDYVAEEAYSHECISAGWWPGGNGIEDASFYAYAYPEPNGYPMAAVHPASAHYHPTLREWLLPYRQVQASTAPDATLLAFLQSTYESAAKLGRWNREGLDRQGSRRGAI